jgi:hypothetical protein
MASEIILFSVSEQCEREFVMREIRPIARTLQNEPLTLACEFPSSSNARLTNTTSIGDRGGEVCCRRFEVKFNHNDILFTKLIAIGAARRRLKIFLREIQKGGESC